MADPVAPQPSTAPVIQPRWAGRTIGQGSATHYHEGEAFIPPGGKLTILRATLLCGIPAEQAEIDNIVLFPPMAGFDNSNLMIGDKKLPSVAAEAGSAIAEAFKIGDAVITNKSAKQAHVVMRMSVNKK